MARYTGPKTKIARKFGEAIFGPDKVLSKKNYPPGQHGVNRRRKTSEYGVMLAEKQKAILLAEGEATARIRKAEAEARAIDQITQAVGQSSNPANYLLAKNYIQMMEQLAQGDKTKTVFLPYEASNMLGSLGGIKELFK